MTKLCFTRDSAGYFKLPAPPHFCTSASRQKTNVSVVQFPLVSAGVMADHPVSPMSVVGEGKFGGEDTSPAPSRKRPRAKAAYPRKRAVQACRTCRLRRTKCDNEQPACTSCVGMGIECTYQTSDPST